MNVKIMLFGSLADAVGTNEIFVEGNSTGELVTSAEKAYPALKDKTFRIAVNQELVSENTLIDPNGEIAFLPPFAGG